MEAGGCLLRAVRVSFEEHVRRILDKVLQMANRPVLHIHSEEEGGGEAEWSRETSQKKLKIGYPKPLDRRHVEKIFDAFGEYCAQWMPANLVRYQGYLVCLEYRGLRRACLVNLDKCWLVHLEAPAIAFKGSVLACVWTSKEIRIHDALVVGERVVTHQCLVKRLTEAATLFPTSLQSREYSSDSKVDPSSSSSLESPGRMIRLAHLSVAKPFSLFDMGECTELDHLPTLDLCEIWLSSVDLDFYSLACERPRFVGQHLSILASCRLDGKDHAAVLEFCVPRGSSATSESVAAASVTGSHGSSLPPPPPTPLSPHDAHDLCVVGRVYVGRASTDSKDSLSESDRLAVQENIHVSLEDKHWVKSIQDRLDPIPSKKSMASGKKPESSTTCITRLRLMSSPRRGEDRWVPDALLPDSRYPLTPFHHLCRASRFIHFHDLRHIIASIRQEQGVPSL